MSVSRSAPACRHSPKARNQADRAKAQSSAGVGPPAFDRHLSREIRQTNFGYRLHNQHLELGRPNNQEACVDPYPRGPDWMPITPKMEWAPWGGRLGVHELTVGPGFRKMEAHGQAPRAQH